MVDEDKSVSEDQRHKKNKRRRLFLWIVIGLLALVNGFLIFRYVQQDEELSKTSRELVASDSLRVELEKELEDYRREVAAYKGEVHELDSMLTEKNLLLEEKAERIRELLSQNQITSSKYKKAREELETLRYYTSKYKRQIDSLFQENKKLRDQNLTLKQEVRQQKIEADKLKDKTTHLENKVALGSKLEAREIMVEGVKIKGGGKERETMNASKIDQLKICFTLKENIIADKEQKDFFIKILDPNGETLNIGSSGSGTFDYRGEPSLFTVKKTIMFQNKPDEQYCAYWSKGGEFEEGVYKIEIYSEGYIVGSNTFELKSGFGLF